MKFLLIEAEFYKDLADELAKGAIDALEAAGHTVERVQVPGVLEIPIALSTIFEAPNHHYDGCIALGCVIRGETSHYDIVANESAAALMHYCTKHKIPLGNGILTVEDKKQAWVRASLEQKNKGRDAALAAIKLAEIKKNYHD